MPIARRGREQTSAHPSQRQWIERVPMQKLSRH